MEKLWKGTDASNELNTESRPNKIGLLEGALSHLHQQEVSKYTI